MDHARASHGVSALDLIGKTEIRQFLLKKMAEMCSHAANFINIYRRHHMSAFTAIASVNWQTVNTRK